MSVYRICDASIQNADPITNVIQQWQILEKHDQEQANIRNKIIIDLSNFIDSLKKKNHEVLWGINTNESNILYNNGVSQLLQRTKLINIID